MSYRIPLFLLLVTASLAGCDQNPREAALSDLAAACEMPIQLAGANAPTMGDCTELVPAIRSCPQVTVEEIRGLGSATRDAALAKDLPSFSDAAAKYATALPGISAKLVLCRLGQVGNPG